jgi:hypothetical protein
VAETVFRKSAYVRWKGTGKLSMSEKTVEQVCVMYICTSRKLTVKANKRLTIPQPTFWNILHESLHMRLYVLHNFYKKLWKMIKEKVPNFF